MNIELSFKVSGKKMWRRVVFSPTQTPKDKLFYKLMLGSQFLFSCMLSRQAISAGTSVSVFPYFYLITCS